MAVVALGLPGTARAQGPATCNGVPATIVASAPGRIEGTPGADVIVGTPGDDLIVGLQGNDLICAGAGDDTLVWNPGDGSDTLEGQEGDDLMQFNGADASETIDISANGPRLRFFRDVGAITIDSDDVERVAFAALGGADQIVVGDLAGTDVALVSLSLAAALGGSAGDAQPDSVTVNGTNSADNITAAGGGSAIIVSGLSATVEISASDGPADSLTVNGLGGADTISTFTAQQVGFRLALPLLALSATRGTSLADQAAGDLPAVHQTVALSAIGLTLNGGLGADTIIGSEGDDLVNGGDGDDVVFLGAGDDTFVWNPGDDNDTIEGQAGLDTMQFNGANVAETIALSANGARARFTRDVANIVMDLDDVERVSFAALGGADTIIANDMSGTDVSALTLDLAGTLGGTVGDAQLDTVVINGTNGADAVEILGQSGVLTATGLLTTLAVSQSESGDRLVVNTLGGDDTVTATTLPAAVVGLTLDGGAGADALVGSQGADVLLGGEGSDTLDGDRGDDVAFFGAGDDTFVWNPGDGSDTLEGQDGSDLMQFNGANASENIDVSSNGGRVRFFRDVASIVMDLDDVERIAFAALGGADTIVTGDLSGTDVTQLSYNLAGDLGSDTGDGQADSVTVNGTNGADTIGVAGAAGQVNVTGLPTAISILNAEPASDRLTMNALGGTDLVDASALPVGAIRLTINGGLGADTIIGSQGDDLVNGGDGDDVVFLGAGDDTFVWNPGDDNDTLEGQAGFDTMQFNGANVAENITISANGGRVIFFRNVANVTMDLNDMERVSFAALGGADSLITNDLSGTDVSEIVYDLAGTLGGAAGDAQPDTVIVNGSAGDDTILVTGSGARAQVLGLAAQVTVLNAEAASDRLVVNALAGDDVVEASGLPAGILSLTADGGADNDVLVGSAGDDTLLGGDGDDVLLGGPGIDILDGGAGDNIVIQD